MSEPRSGPWPALRIEMASFNNGDGDNGERRKR
jgi:hypothetical protein